MYFERSYFDSNHVAADGWATTGAFDGVLIEAKDLINGVSIVQAERADKVEYFHIELDTHDVIVAEGALSETFIDDECRGMFHNAHEFHALYPQPRSATARYCAPRRNEGFEVAGVRRRIALRAGLIASADPRRAGTLRGAVEVIGSCCVQGWAQNAKAPDATICLDIYAGERRLGRTLANLHRADLAAAGQHAFSFTLPDDVLVEGEILEVRRSSDSVRLPTAAHCAAA